MMEVVIFEIEAGNKPEVTAKASSKKSAFICIKAETLQEAHALLERGEALASHAMKTWQPEAGQDEQPQTVPAHDEPEEPQEAFIETAAGKRFLHQIESAKLFTYKHCKKFLGADELEALADLHSNSLINGSGAIAALYYRRGYRNGKADKKQAFKK